MPLWITAVGIGSLGAVYGYLLFYGFKRQQTPLVEKPLPLKEVVSLLAAIGSGGMLGGAFLLLEGVNYIGPYGIGLAIGVAINVKLTMRHEMNASYGSNNPTLVHEAERQRQQKA